jgi:hypothetical protein
MGDEEAENLLRSAEEQELSKAARPGHPADPVEFTNEVMEARTIEDALAVVARHKDLHWPLVIDSLEKIARNTDDATTRLSLERQRDLLREALVRHGSIG